MAWQETMGEAAGEFIKETLGDAFKMTERSVGSINPNPIATSIRNAVSNTVGFFTAPARAVGRGVSYAATHGKGNPGSMKGMAEAVVGGDGSGITDIHIGGEKLEDGTYKGGMWVNGAKTAALGSGLGIGYRFLSGGGVYRDKDGNTDIAGIPFV